MIPIRLLNITMILGLLTTLSSPDLLAKPQARKNINLNKLFTNQGQAQAGNFTENSPRSREDTRTPKVYGTVRVNSSLRVRTDVWGTIIGKLYNGDRVRVDLAQSKPKWYKIFRDNLSGFSHSRYIVLDSDQDYPVVDPVPIANPTPNPPPAPEPSRPTPVPSGDLAKNVDTSDGAYILGVPSFKQKANDPFSPDGSSWRPEGYCGPTSLQMVLAYYGVEKSRDDLALTVCSANGEVLRTDVKSEVHQGQVYAKGNGASWPALVSQGKRFGFKHSNVQMGVNMATIRERVAAGRPQIISVRGDLKFKNGNPYTTQGHVMVIRGVRENGDVVINDPVRGADMVMSEHNFVRVWKGNAIDIKR